MKEEKFPAAGCGNLEMKTEWCKGCGLCVNACPKKVLSLDKRGKIQVDHPEKCVACGICESTCPDFVISVRMTKYA